VNEHGLERTIGRILGLGTVAGVAILVVGLVAMAASGIDPLTRPFPAFNLQRLPSDLAAARPEGFVWLGLLVLLATPAARVTASLVGFAAQGDRRMVAIAVAVLAVMALGVAIGMGA
jgi:uncharacterized membrane protein